ncbi:MAG: NUDIX hydrolase [Verrucomicrobia bacterium]|nr:NUDIX hydrolase [Verrucomicrobiota bacterium]
MEPKAHFHFCPRCGHQLAAPPAEPRLRCAACGFQLFFNPAVSVGAFIFRPDGAMLWLRRAKDPRRGKLGLPGGFIDFNETAEAALDREVREEVGIAARDVKFVLSLPNRYEFAGVTYPVLDLFFTAQAIAPDQARPLDEVSELLWRRPEGVALDEIAFVSVREALVRFREGLA